MRPTVKLILLLLCLSSLTIYSREEHPYLILISFDGFRWDYANRGVTPNLDKFRQEGVSALSLEPVYPTKTFPNHLSIITGLYPENHGIILNEFENPVTGEQYNLSNEAALRDSKWYLGEAFWETAERQGIITASYFWPGSQLTLVYRRPTYWEPYEHNRPYEQRVEGLLNWLKLPEDQRPHFITLYFHETDSKGHDFGPDSPEVNQAISLLDSVLGSLIDGITRLDLDNQVNIIVVSDHGMTEVNTDRIVNVEKMIGEYACRYIGEGPFLMIRPEEKEMDAVYNLLKQQAQHFRVYRREEVPAYFHFSHHPFIPPLVLVADMGWSLHTNKSAETLLKKGYGKGGNHGYDNHQMDMHGIFFALGPAFKKGYRTGTLHNTDIYPLLCRIFHIMPRQNIDGRLERISFILEED